jgi:hypothetical protein
MPHITYSPTPEEVMAALKEQLEKSDFMMLVAVTDTDDPGWRGGDHINFFLNLTPKGWILEGSNGSKYKLSIKQIEPKEKKAKEPKEEVEEEINIPGLESAPEAPPANVTPPAP